MRGWKTWTYLGIFSLSKLMFIIKDGHSGLSRKKRFVPSYDLQTLCLLYTKKNRKILVVSLLRSETANQFCQPWGNFIFTLGILRAIAKLSRDPLIYLMSQSLSNSNHKSFVTVTFFLSLVDYSWMTNISAWLCTIFSCACLVITRHSLRMHPPTWIILHCKNKYRWTERNCRTKWKYNSQLGHIL